MIRGVVYKKVTDMEDSPWQSVSGCRVRRECLILYAQWKFNQTDNVAMAMGVLMLASWLRVDLIVKKDNNDRECHVAWNHAHKKRLNIDVISVKSPHVNVSRFYFLCG